MRHVALIALAGLATAVSFGGAFAQQPAIDCGNPQNALTAYCNNRDAMAPVGDVPVGGIVIVPDVPTTGSIIQGGPPSVEPAIDCGNPQNALTVYCNNRP